MAGQPTLAVHISLTLRPKSVYSNLAEELLVVSKTRNQLYGNRSGCENLTLAIPSPDNIPCCHGNTACLTTRGVGTDPTRGASLYSGAGSPCGDLDIHGPRLPGAGRHVAGTVAPDVTACFPPPPRAIRHS